MDQAWVHEIFASIQGEGPRIGERHIFVRFFGCDIGCRFCDTPAALSIQHAGTVSTCSVHMPARPDHDRLSISNPVAGDDLTIHCDRLIIHGPSKPILSLTGGEPLLQADFLRSWLPGLRGRYRIYLETSGVHDAALRSVQGLVDVVSMDFKLPSSTGLRPYWEEHKRCLTASRGSDLFVKAVVTNDTLLGDVITSARILAGQDRIIPFILQPSVDLITSNPSKLAHFQDAALGLLSDVRVIPQIHKILNVP